MNAVELPDIPANLCGVNGCTYTPHTGQHTWEERTNGDQ